jgi:hypothetical protein
MSNPFSENMILPVDQPNSILAEKAQQLNLNLRVKRTISLPVLVPSWARFPIGFEPIPTDW